MRNQSLATILANRRPHTIADVTRLAYRSRYSFDTNEIPTLVQPRNAYSASERAWFRRPLGALVLVIGLAIGGTAHADRAVSPTVAAAKHEIAEGRAHLKAARATERAAHKSTANAKRIAKLRAALAKAECGVCVADSPTSCLCPAAGGK